LEVGHFWLLPARSHPHGNRLGFGEIGGITVHIEAHVAGVVANGGVRMGSGVVEEVDSRFSGGEGAFGLGGGKASKGNQDGVVNCSTIVKEDTNDLLKLGNPSGVKWFSGVDWSDELGMLTVGWFGPFGWGVLGSGGRGDFESLESLGNVAGHG
jgi:hypothetical protein